MGAIQGQIFAQITAGIVGIILFYYSFLRNYKDPLNKTALRKTLKTLLKYGVPLSVSTVIAGFLPQFYNTVLTQTFSATNYSYTTALGNFQAALNFTVIITFFTVPITTVQFPAFSKLKAEKEKETLRAGFTTSVKYAALLTIPVTLMMMVLSQHIVFAVVGTEYTDTPFFLSIYNILYLYVGKGNLSLASFLNGQSKTQVTMKMAFITLSMGLLFGWTLISQFGVIGLIATTLIAGFPSTVVGLLWIKKNYGATVDWNASAKIFLASVIATGSTYLILAPVNFEYWIEMVLGGASFLAVYLVVAPLIRAVDKKDITRLRQMLRGLGPFSYVFNIPLSIMEKLSGIFKS